MFHGSWSSPFSWARIAELHQLHPAQAGASAFHVRKRGSAKQRQEIFMQRQLSMAALALLCGCVAASAQTSTTPSAMGTTSPLGTLDTSGTSGTGLPLGATEIDPGGLGTLANSTCNASGSTGSIFDGGGWVRLDQQAQAPAARPRNPSSTTGTASPVSSPGASSTLTLNGGNIPLGATETNTTGASPLIAIPTPSISSMTSGTTTTPCASSMTTSSAALATGSIATASSSGCWTYQEHDMRKLWLVLLVGLIGVGGAALAARQFRQAAPNLGSIVPAAVPVVAGTVPSHDVPIYLRGVGTVIAYNNVIVRSQITGQLVMITFTQGQTVKKGDLANRRV
jgi:hypothetical protein